MAWSGRNRPNNSGRNARNRNGSRLLVQIDLVPQCAQGFPGMARCVILNARAVPSLSHRAAINAPSGPTS